MDIRKNKDDKGRDALELLISGRVDGAGAIRLYDELQSTLGSGTQTVYINMALVTFLCSAALAALINFSQKMWKLKRVVRIAHPSPEVETVLRTSGLYEQLIERA